MHHCFLLHTLLMRAASNAHASLNDDHARRPSRKSRREVLHRPALLNRRSLIKQCHKEVQQA
jgi:hypothetical protein